MNHTNLTIAEAITSIERQLRNPTEGLPDELFYFISRTTPLVNVDLLLQDERGRTLLSWRDDQYAGKGWHIPGGIVRFKETFGERILKVAAAELGCSVRFEPEPIALNQLIHKERATRGHFISLLYRCHLPTSFLPQNSGLVPGERGYLQWHDTCPDNLITYHDIYRKFISGDSDQ